MKKTFGRLGLVTGIAVLMALLAACGQTADRRGPQAITEIVGMVDSRYAGAEIYFEVAEEDWSWEDVTIVYARPAATVGADGTFRLELPSELPEAALWDVLEEFRELCGSGPQFLGWPLAELTIHYADLADDYRFSLAEGDAAGERERHGIFMYAAQDYRWQQSCSDEEDGHRYVAELNFDMAAGWNYLAGTFEYHENASTGTTTESIKLVSSRYEPGSRWHSGN